MVEWWWTIVAAAVGACAGVMVIAICFVAQRADRNIKATWRRKCVYRGTTEQIANALETWSTGNLIDYIYNLQEVMYSACKVSLDLCETCDLDPEKCKGFAFPNVKCSNYKLRDDIRKVQVSTK